MNLRRAALLVAIGAGCHLLYALSDDARILACFGGQFLHSPTFLIAPIGALCALSSQTVFFGFLFAEGSRRMGSHARATAALAAAVPAFVWAGCAVWETGEIVYVCGQPNAHCMFSVPAAVAWGALSVLTGIGWAVFFLAFAEKVHAFPNGAIPKLAVLLAIMEIVEEMHVFVAPGSLVTLVNTVGHAISLFTVIAFVMFAVVLCRKWDSRKPIHDIILD